MTAPAPKLSICLPAYNYAHFLPKAIESVLIQDFKDYELIILDDVSPDNTQEIAMEYAKKDPRIRYILNEKNLGAIENCNKGVAVARGEYVAFLSADDFYLPGWLQAGVDFLESNLDVDLVYCKTILVDSENHYCNTTTIPSFANFSHKGRDELREHIKTGGSFFHLAATIMRKRMMNELGFYKKWNMQQGFSAEDWEANLNFSLHKIEGYINRPYYAFRVHDSNFSSQNKVLENGALVRSHLYILDKFLTPETTYRIRGAQKEALRSLFGQVNMLSKQAPEIAEKVLPEIYPQLNDVKNRLVQLGQLPITPLSEQPLVTVVIPTVNMASCAGNTLFPSGRDIFFILNALESLCQQTYTNWQAVIVNDGGEDIAPLLEDFKQKHQPQQKIQYFYFNVNQGQAAARNVALEFIWQGELVAFLDDDDLYLPNHLETIVKTLRGTNIPCAYTNYTSIVEKCLLSSRPPLEQIPVHLPPVYSKSLLAVKNYIPMSAFVLRRECILDHEIRFDPSLKILEDWDFLLKLSNLYEFTYIPTQTVEIRQREQSDSVHQLRIGMYLEAYKRICKLYYTDDLIVNRGRQALCATLEKNEKRLDDRERYHQWRSKKEEYIEQNLLTFLHKMQKNWHVLPQFLILISVDAHTAQYLQKTLDSLKEQYYKNYSIFVLKTEACSINEDALINAVYDVYSDAHIKNVIQSLVQSDPSDWTIAFPADTILNPQFSLALADYINQDQNHNQHLIYFDEANLSNLGGRFTDPQFKTDFNLDLFRAYPAYIGTCLAIKSKTLKTYMFPIFTPGWSYQLGLNIYDAFGGEAIGHIDDIFVHMVYDLNPNSKALDRALYQSILSDHLNTYGIQAPVVINNFGQYTPKFFFDIQYQLKRKTRVTILCTTIKDPITWMENVTTLLARTHYPDYEFVVISTIFDQYNKEVFAFYRELQKQDQRCRLIEAVTEIESPYLFDFDENLIISEGQETWLTRLVGCIERKDIVVDMVQPAWIDPQTDLAVNLFPIDSIEMVSNTWFERQQLPQQFAHFNSLRNTLVKTDFFCDPDFSLTDSVYTAIYLPTVRLGYRKTSLDENQSYRWMRDSISYNKNLSLTDPFQVEQDFLINWRLGLKQSAVKKVLQLSSSSFDILKNLVSQGKIQYTQLEIEKRTPLLEELIRFAPDVIVLTLSQSYKELHTHMHLLKQYFPHLHILLFIDQFNVQVEKLSLVDRYKIRAALCAFDYISRALVVDVNNEKFEGYSEILPCDSIIITKNMSDFPENYLDILF